MDNDNSEEIYRLNKKIKELLAFSEKTFSRNSQLENENSKLRSELDNIKSSFNRSSTQNIQFRFDLERITLERDNIFLAHQKQKSLLNDLMKKHNTQFKQLKQFENIIAKSLDNLLPYAQIYAKRRPVTVIGTVADQLLAEKVRRLEANKTELEEELQQSYEIIDQLEFEIEEVSRIKNIDYLESENQRLEEELNTFRASITDIGNQIPNNNNNDTIVYNDENDSLSPPHEVDAEKLVSDKHTRRNLLHKKLETLHQNKRCSLGIESN